MIIVEKFKEEKTKKHVWPVLRLVISFILAAFFYTSTSLAKNWEYYTQSQDAKFLHLFIEPGLLLFVLVFLWCAILILLKVKGNKRPKAESIELLSNYTLFLPIIVLLFQLYLCEYIFFLDKFENANYFTILLLHPILVISYFLYLLFIIFLSVFRILYLFREIYQRASSVVCGLILSLLCLDSWYYIYFTLALIKLRLNWS